MLETITLWLVETVGALGYPGIIILMALESSFFPFPSEVVMVPAGYLAQQGKMNLGLAIACGIIGSLLGAWFNYGLAFWLGRKALIKWGHYVFISEEKINRAEIFLKAHGAIGTIVGRLIPVIRQYISFPAGLIRMSLASFTVCTGIGAGIWVTVLALIGYYVGENQAMVEKMSKTAMFWVLAVSAVAVLVYWKIHKRK